MSRARALRGLWAAHQLSADSDVTVHPAGGTYRLSKPLAFGSADEGRSGHTVAYQAVAGQQPVVSGVQQISGLAGA